MSVEQDLVTALLAKLQSEPQSETNDALIAGLQGPDAEKIVKHVERMKKILGEAEYNTIVGA